MRDRYYLIRGILTAKSCVEPCKYRFTIHAYRTPRTVVVVFRGRKGGIEAVRTSTPIGHEGRVLVGDGYRNWWYLAAVEEDRREKNLVVFLP